MLHINSKEEKLQEPLKSDMDISHTFCEAAGESAPDIWIAAVNGNSIMI
jgi:hypothetical protein